MTLDVIASVPQIDGGTRYLLDTTAEASRMRARIRETGLVDSVRPAYLVDVSRDGRRTAERYPGDDVTAEEWRAIRAAMPAR